MNGPVEKLFRVLRLINNNDEPMSPQQIAAETEMNVRTVQRHALRLAEEGLIDFGNRANGYQFMKRGTKI